MHHSEKLARWRDRMNMGTDNVSAPRLAVQFAYKRIGVKVADVNC